MTELDHRNQELEVMTELEACKIWANNYHRQRINHDIGALVSAIQSGDMLRTAKSLVVEKRGDGKWLPWLEENFEGGRTTATLYMRISAKAEEIGFQIENRRAGSQMSIREFERTYLPPEPKAIESGDAVDDEPEPEEAKLAQEEEVRAEELSETEIDQQQELEWLEEDKAEVEKAKEEIEKELERLGQETQAAEEAKEEFQEALDQLEEDKTTAVEEATEWYEKEIERYEKEIENNKKQWTEQYAALLAAHNIEPTETLVDTINKVDGVDYDLEVLRDQFDMSLTNRKHKSKQLASGLTTTTGWLRTAEHAGEEVARHILEPNAVVAPQDHIEAIEFLHAWSGEFLSTVEQMRRGLSVVPDISEKREDIQ